MSGWEKLGESFSCPQIDVEGNIEGVSVVLGTFHEHLIDTATKGIDPQPIERSYFRDSSRYRLHSEADAPNVLGWYLNYSSLFYIDYGNPLFCQNIAMAHPSGGLLHFKRNSWKEPFRIASLKGYMNDSSGFISGTTHIKNTYILHNEKQGCYELRFSDGGFIYFPQKQRFKTNQEIQRTYGYFQILPSGNRLTTEEDKLKTKAPDGTELNWIRLLKEGSFPIGIETSDQKIYRFVKSQELRRKGVNTYLLQEWIRPDGTRVKYEYNNKGMYKGDDLLLVKRFPDGRYQRICYLNEKVWALRGPIGPNQSEADIYRFDYHDGYTDVFDAEGNLTQYVYDADKRITKIKHSNRIEKNVWNQEGCLLLKILCDLEEKPYLARRFHYDDKANVIKEELIGNLSGTCFIPIELDKKGFPKENGVERAIKHYTYSQDDFHLLTSEDDGQIKVLYSYVPCTNLLRSKLIGDEKGIRLRQFRAYDSMGALCLLIEDDGSSPEMDDMTGCSLRKIKRIQNLKQFPGVGQPEVIEEKYFDFEKQQEKLIKKTLYFYDKHNQCIKEDIYDADGNFKYCLSKTYDVMGRCLYEKDAMGGEIHREYDANGNLTKEMGPRKGVYTEYGYDCSNRLLWVKKGDLENAETTRFRYDKLGNCLCQVDDGGNETFFQYEEKKQIKVHLPEAIRASEKKYDLADRVIEEIDEEENRTLTEYTIRGQPISITKISKEGKSTKESFQYDLKGNCTKKVAPNGSITFFTYDFLDRVVQTEHYDKDLVLLAKTSATYSAFSILSTTDAENVVTLIEYDAIGREKRITKGSQCCEKEYDSLGNLAVQKEWVDDISENVLVKKYRTDFLSRVTEEKIEDGRGTLFEKRAYGYDEDSNLIQMTTFATEKGETTTFQFDFLGRETKRSDPLGHEAKTIYRYDMANGHGQLSLFKKEIDPLGNVTETTYDARGRVEKIIKKDPLGHEILSSQYGYDGCNRMVFRKEGDKITRFKFNHLGKETEISEEDGSETRCASLTYNDAGELMQKETALSVHRFFYDGAGRISSYFAYDKKSASAPLKIAYEYDRNGKLLKIAQEDGETLREYDDNGNLIWETQESGLKIGYEYDRIGRRIKMTLPDTSYVSYSYRGPHLFEVSFNNEPVYTYTKRDLAGKIKETIGKALTTQFSYDASGRQKLIHTESWSQKGEYDALGNLIKIETKDPYGKTSTTFSYTSLNQLASEDDVKYQYDSANNRLDGEMGLFNQLLSQEDERFLWDEEGRLISPECIYDPLNRLCKDQNHKYKFDGLNRRIGKECGFFVYDGDNEIGFYEEGKFKELRILGEGKGAEIGATILIVIGKQMYTPINDIRGNIVCLTDMSKEIKECTRYSAFGEEENLAQTKNPWRFCSKRVDDSGLIFFGRRHYFPKIGRWTTPDPIWSPNAYAYVSNNPLTHFDLYGYREGPLGSTSFIDFGARLFHAAMSALEWIGKNMIPIPGLRDVIESIGRGLSGGKFFEIPEYRQSFTQCTTIEGKKIEGHSFIWVNGVRTTLEEARQAGKNFSESLGGIQVYVIYNATNGLLTDLLECILLKGGILSAPEKKIIETVRSIFSDSPNEIVHINAHSQGGLHLYNAAHHLSKSERNQIEVNTFGSAKLISDGIFSKASNFVSKFDFVPLISDPIAYISSFFKRESNVRFLPSSSFNPFKEHFIMGNTYQNVIIQAGGIFK